MPAMEVWIDDSSLGGVALVGYLEKAPNPRGDVLSFEYASDWLAGNCAVAPFQLDPDLPLFSGRMFAHGTSSNLTGAFQDCSPDRWGCVLMDRREAIDARLSGRHPGTLRAWDYLVGVHDHARMGALRLRDPTTKTYIDNSQLSAPPVAELRTLEEAARQLETKPDAPAQEQHQWLMQLLAPGTSLGGARPKASFTDVDGSMWLAKFPSADDRYDVGLWEFVCHRLAQSAGISMPEARVTPLSSSGHTYCVRRFDRTDQSRRAYASAMTLLGADASGGRSYLDLAELIEHEGTSDTIEANLEQLFRRMVFNVLVGNRDDHLRNHGFIRKGNGWVLSPAFDVNPNPYKQGHVLGVCFDDPMPGADKLVAMHEFFHMSEENAQGLLGQIRQTVSGWADQARRAGALGVEITMMGAVIDADR